MNARTPDRQNAPRARRLVFVAHNRNHVTIMSGAAHLCGRTCADICFAAVDGHEDERAVRNAAAERGFAVTSAAAFARTSAPGDVVCVGNDWGPRRFVANLKQLRRRGAKIFGMVEGARFGYRNHYANVDKVLCWGPSGVATLPGQKIIVGSPAIEAAMKTPAAPSRPLALINYKFTRGAAEYGPAWVRAAVDACTHAGLDYVISAHPLNAAELGGLVVSHEPFLTLLRRSSLIVTRASTAIYEALACNVQAIYFPFQDEWRAEFADPGGAFSIAEDLRDLARLVQLHVRDSEFPIVPARAFLRKHVDIDATVGASARIALVLAEAINSIEAGVQPQRGISAAFAKAVDTLRGPKREPKLT